MALKFYLWLLEKHRAYRKVVYLDADTLVLDGVEELFSVPDSVFVTDPVFHWIDSNNRRVDVLNFGVMVVKPSLTVFESLVLNLGKCKDVLAKYPLHDLTDASFLDCVWRLEARRFGSARFHFNFTSLDDCGE